MSVTNLAVVNDQIQKFWAPIFMKELRESLLLGALVNKDYKGSIQKLGDEVTISQLNAPQGELRTAGVDADSFGSETMTLKEVKLKANKRAVASFDIEELVDIQSQLGAQESEIRNALRFAVDKQINDYLYSLVSPSTSAPDHLLASTAAYNATTHLSVRKLAAKARWLKDKGWWTLLDPLYYNDMLGATTMTSSDFVGDDTPVVGGQIAKQRFGFNILEDNSLDQATEGYGLIFHPDFMNLAMQMEPRFKLSDQHANKKFAYVLSCDLIFGAALGIDGDKKHIVVKAAA